MQLRGIRGATTVKKDSKEEIISATRELLQEMVKFNDLNIDDIASIVFTTTKDLKAEFPAVAARALGWKDTPLLCAREIDVPKSLSKCIRILMHINTSKKPSEIKHVYLNEAINLRR